MLRWVVRLPWYWRWPALLGGFVLIGLAAGFVVRYALWPHVTSHGVRLGWFDWATLAGVVLTVIGLAIALVQIAHVKSASEASREAIDRALARLGRGELLMDFQQLRSLEYDRAMSPGADGEAMQRWIRDVRDVAGRIVSTLRSANEADELIPVVEGVREAALQARLGIIGGGAQLDLWEITQTLRERLVPACDMVGTRMNEMRLDVRDEGGDGDVG